MCEIGRSISLWDVIDAYQQTNGYYRFFSCIYLLPITRSCNVTAELVTIVNQTRIWAYFVSSSITGFLSHGTKMGLKTLEMMLRNGSCLERCIGMKWPMDHMANGHLGLGLNCRWPYHLSLNCRVSHFRLMTSPGLKLPTQSQMADKNIFKFDILKFMISWFMGVQCSTNSG